MKNSSPETDGKDNKIRLEICMGSSCFRRGNRLTLPAVRDFVRQNDLEGSVEIEGRLCSESCSEGPVIVVDGVRHDGIPVDSLKDLMLRKLEEK